MATADFAVAAPSGTFITNVKWTVRAAGGETTQATNILPLASHTQAIGFDATATGEYLITVDVNNEDRVALTGEEKKVIIKAQEKLEERRY